MKVDLPAKIQTLINNIEGADVIDNSLISEFVESSKLTMDDLEPYTTFDHDIKESYGRNLIYQNKNFRILLMSWSAGDFTAIHNHGFIEWGCVLCFGEAIHRLYEMKGDQLCLTQKGNFRNGEIATVCGDLTHLMGNSGIDNFTTLHIYGANSKESPVSSNTKVYYPELQNQISTMGSAYLNMNRDLILSEKQFSNFSKEAISDYYELVIPFYKRINKLPILQEIKEALH